MFLNCDEEGKKKTSRLKRTRGSTGMVEGERKGSLDDEGVLVGSMSAGQ